MRQRAPVRPARILSRSEKQFSSIRRPSPRDESAYSREAADTCAPLIYLIAPRAVCPLIRRLEKERGNLKSGEISSFGRRLPSARRDCRLSVFILLTRALISIAWAFTTHRNDSPRASRREQSLGSESTLVPPIIASLRHLNPPTRVIKIEFSSLPGQKIHATIRPERFTAAIKPIIKKKQKKEKKERGKTSQQQQSARSLARRPANVAYNNRLFTARAGRSQKLN